MAKNELNQALRESHLENMQNDSQNMANLQLQISMSI
jgi:hypothetical protein